MSTSDLDTARRRFLSRSVGVVGAVGSAFVAVPFVASWMPSAKAKAIGAPVEVDISKLEPGQMMVENWRGKPVWILRRSPEVVEALSGLNNVLSDPDSEDEQQPEYAKNQYRSIKPEYLVVTGICTHLGCSPQHYAPDRPNDLGDDWVGGFFCPCHGSKFDLAGRVYQGVPAPTNLVVPPHKYISDSRLVIGLDQGEAT